MKKLVLSFIASIFAMSSFAHDSTDLKRTPEQMAGKRADKLKTELGLNDEQRAQVYSAVLEKINKTKAIKKKYKDSANKKGMGVEMKSVKNAFDAKMNVILTPEQKTKFEALKKTEREENGDDEHGEKKGKSKNKPGEKKNNSKSKSESEEKDGD